MKLDMKLKDPQMDTQTTLQTQKKNPFAWFLQRGYLQGVFWILLVSLTSNMNDIIMRLVGSHLPAPEVTFFRYFFAVVTLLPIMLIEGKKAFYTSRPLLHVVRSLLLFAAIACWAQGVKMLNLAVVSTIALTVPIFVLPMASFILKEKVGWQRVTATFVGFLGIFYVTLHSAGAVDLSTFSIENTGILYLLFAALSFACSDIINKKFVSQESNLSMLFYIALGTALIALYPATTVWVTPTNHEFAFLLLLGAGGNLILFFLLKAFAATDVSALAPYRYAELIFATGFGWLLFNEFPDKSFWYGSLLIVLSTAAISYYELHKKR